MIRLTKAQNKMRDEFLNNHIQKKLSSDDPSVWCFFCKRAGGVDEDGLFTTHIPTIDPADISKGLMMDAMEAIWICPKCVEGLQ